MKSVEEIKEEYDLLKEVRKTVQLSRRGVDYWGCCPFHSENTPSFKVSPHTGKYKCFGCGKSGDVIDWKREIDGIELLSSSAHGKAGINTSAILETALNYYQEVLNTNKNASWYLMRRKVFPDNARQYHIGAATEGWCDLYNHLSKLYPDEELLESGLFIISRNKGQICDLLRGRIIFPIYNEHGKLKGFSGRTYVNDNIKCLIAGGKGSFNKNELFLGFPTAMEHIKETGEVLVVEGNFDVLAMARAGKRNCIAICGSAISKKHIAILEKYCSKATLCFDGDNPGREAVIKAAPLLLSGNLQTEVITLPEGEDPDSFVCKGRAIGELISTPLEEYILSTFSKKNGDSVHGKAKTASNLLNIIEAIENRAKAEIYARYFADASMISAESLIGKRAENAYVEKKELSDIEKFCIFFPEHAAICYEHNKDNRLIEAITNVSSPEESINAAPAEYRESIAELIKNGCSLSEPSRPIERYGDVISFLGGYNNSEDDDLSLHIPRDIVYGGGLIDLGLKGLSCPGLPKQWQFSFPTVLAVLGQVASGLVSAAGTTSNLYNCRLATSGGGKSEIDKAMSRALKRAGVGDIVGPGDFASGPAVINYLTENPNIVCFLDEVTGYLTPKKGAERDNNGLVPTLLQLYWKSGEEEGHGRVYSSNENNKKLDWFSFGFVGNATNNLLNYLTDDTVSSGLMGRVDIFAYLGRPMARGVWAGESPELSKFAQGIYHLNNRKKIDDNGKRIICSLSLNSIIDRVNKLDQYIIDKIGDDYRNNVVTALYNKMYKGALKFAIIHHIANQPIHCIYDPMEPESIEWGVKISEALVDWKVNKMLKNINYGDFDTDCKVFLDALNAAWRRKIAGKEGYPTRKTIASKRRATRNWPPQRWEQIIDALSSAGEIKVDGERITPCS